MPGIGLGTHTGTSFRRVAQPAPAPIQSAERIAAMRSQVLSNPIALSGGRNIALTRFTLYTGAQDWASFRFRFATWFHTNAAVSANKEQPDPGPVTIIAAALEKATVSTPALSVRADYLQRRPALGDAQQR